MKKIVAVFFLSITGVFAAGGGHSAGHITDIIAPAVNFILLAGFMIFKLRKPISEHFTDKSQTIVETLERATVKSKEAKLKLEINQKKLYDSEDEIRNIVSQAKNDADKFAKDFTKEMSEKTEKMKADAVARVEYEKKAILDKLSEELVSEVVVKAKHLIASDSSKQSKVSEKLMRGI